METLHQKLMATPSTAKEIEGHCGQVPPQQLDLATLVSAPGVRRVLEIGFNAGHSADLFLRTNPACELVSFDLGSHDYVQVGKEHIDAAYPGRHRLILGDSRLTLPAYRASHPAETFDLLFIDGGHDDDIPALDLQHCLELAHTDSLIVLDDTMMYPVARAWQVALVSERIEQLGSSTYTEYGGRAMAWGRLKRD